MNLLQDGAPVVHQSRVRHGQRHVFIHAVEETGIALIEEHVRERGRAGPRSDRVGRLLAHEAEDVGANVPAAERVQVPVCGHGGDGGVVVVEGGVGGAG